MLRQLTSTFGRGVCGGWGGRGKRLSTICHYLHCYVLLRLRPGLWSPSHRNLLARYAELAYAKKHGKGLYLVRLAPRVADASASLLLGTVQVCLWGCTTATVPGGGIWVGCW